MSLAIEKESKRLLRYSDELVHDLKLLEVPEELMEELEHGRVAFKGVENGPGHHADAVLCTSKSTYEVREVETTNLVMLIDNPESSSTGQNAAVSVTALSKAHLELSLINPKLHMLDKALKEDHVITEIIRDGGDAALPKGETWEALRDKVQASDAEIAKALVELDAVRVDGGWMGVSPESYSSFVRLVLLTLTEHGWKLDRVPCVELAEALEKSGVCGQVTLQLLRKMQLKGPEGSEDSGGLQALVEDLDRQDWRELPSPPAPCVLDLSAVCKHVGVGMLLEKETWDDKEEFMANWQGMLPDGVVPSMKMLTGEALEVDSEMLGEHGVKTLRAGVRRLSVADLPRDTTRFEILFKVKQAWRLEEILPYISGLAAPGQNTEELLLKHARPSQTRPEDPVLYTKR